MKNKLKLITAFILGILVTSITVYAITVKSTNVIFTPVDETWNVSSVEEALNDLHKNGNSVYYLGTDTSYNIKELIENHILPDSIDYTKLTSDNFLVGIVSVPNSYTCYCGFTSQCGSAQITFNNVSGNYNSVSGELTIDGGSFTLRTCTDDNGNKCKYQDEIVDSYTYLILGNIKDVSNQS